MKVPYQYPPSARAIEKAMRVKDKRSRPAEEDQYTEVVGLAKKALELLYSKRPSRLTASQISENLIDEIVLWEDMYSQKLEKRVRKHLNPKLMSKRRQSWGMQPEPALATYELGPGDTGITEIRCGKATVQIDVTHIINGNVHVKAIQKRG